MLDLLAPIGGPASFPVSATEIDMASSLLQSGTVPTYEFSHLLKYFILYQQQHKRQSNDHMQLLPPFDSTLLSLVSFEGNEFHARS